MVIPQDAQIIYEAFALRGPFDTVGPSINTLDAVVLALDVYGITCRGKSDSLRAKMLIPWGRVISITWVEGE